VQHVSIAGGRGKGGNLIWSGQGGTPTNGIFSSLPGFVPGQLLGGTTSGSSNYSLPCTIFGAGKGGTPLIVAVVGVSADGNTAYLDNNAVQSATDTVAIIGGCGGCDVSGNILSGSSTGHGVGIRVWGQDSSVHHNIFRGWPQTAGSSIREEAANASLTLPGAARNTYEGNRTPGSAGVFKPITLQAGSGSILRGNEGVVASVSAPTPFPTSGTATVNNAGSDVLIIATAGSAQLVLTSNWSGQSLQIPANTTWPFPLRAGDAVTVVYSGGSPSWNWQPF
jgi:hypothetical protein